MSNPQATFTVAHLTTVDLSLRFLVRPQLLAVRDVGGVAIGISAPGPWVGELMEDGIRHIPLTSSTRGMSLLQDLKAAFQLWRVLRTERITVLHTHNPKPGLYGRILGRLAGVPLVVNTMHGFYATETDPIMKRGLVYTLEAVAARFSDLELHQNLEDLELARRTRILPRGKGELLGNGVDLSRFDAEKVDGSVRSEVRSELGIGEGEVVVGIVGRLVAEKGYPELFQAMRRLGRPYRLVVVGPDDPDKADALPREVVEDARRSGVIFLGMRTDVERLYTAMDLFVLPSHREGFPRAAMEAAAMGLPIVATDIRGCRQVVDAGVNGFLVPVDDAEALAGAISEVASDPSRLADMSANSRAKALKQFDERQIVSTVMEAYRLALIAKGLGYLLPPRMVDEPDPWLRPAQASDARALASLHMTEISTGFLPALGQRFMQVLYRALIDWPGTVSFTAEDSSGPVGFVVGVTDVSAFYKDFVKRYAGRAAIAAAPRLIRPSVMRKAWESLRYGTTETEEIETELLSMAVASRARGRGLSTRLGEALFEGMTRLGRDRMKVVVASDNSTAIAAYRRLGFVTDHQIEVHHGEKSEVMVWRA